jgi:hypothetical protein
VGCLRPALIALLATALAGGESLTVHPDGVERGTAAPAVFDAAVAFAPPAGGLRASLVARSLRGLGEDDWRDGSLPIAGTWTDARIHRPDRAFGTAEERARWGVAGSDADWDQFSVQWDGWLRVQDGPVDIAARADDSSRLWLDRDRDGEAAPGEWNSRTLRPLPGGQPTVLQRGVPPGTFAMRLQYEEGGGGNAISLLWRRSGDAAWKPVPALALAGLPVLRLSGPWTVRSAFSGTGELEVGDGAVLTSAPPTGRLSIAGRVRLAADLDLPGCTLALADDALLEVGPHRLRVAELAGYGGVALAGGELSAGGGSGPRLTGRGTLRWQGALALGGLDDGIVLAASGPGTLSSPQRAAACSALRAPLATILTLGILPDGVDTADIRLRGAPAGAGLAAWRSDRHGRWFQRVASGQLDAGEHRQRIAIGDRDAFAPEGQAGTWDAATAAECRRAGLLVWCDRPASGLAEVEAHWRRQPAAAAPPTLTLLGDPPTTAATGTRIELACLPQPFPERPLDPDAFALELAVTDPAGRTVRYAGFPDQPFRRRDRGDREELVADGPRRFAVRFRARSAGLHRLRLSARWGDGGSASVELPPVAASGPDWDGIARPDAEDPRFLSAGGRWVWPIGHNLHSNFDVRSAEVLDTVLTPDRGSFVREALLGRLITAGGDGAEVWLSPWNLGIEWSDAWRGYHGTGRPNLGNAWAMDRLLEQAETAGARLVVTVFNHGMARGTDGEGKENDWPHHPWRAANGGWLATAAGLFTDARARAAQAAQFRYIAARWGDSPAVLAWKLWAENNLANATGEEKRAWHAWAGPAMAAADPWSHPVTTHWSGDWRTADGPIAGDPGMTMLTIDAYHGEDRLLAQLLADSTGDPGSGVRGLGPYRKPILVTEFGGSWRACPPERMAAELASGGWAGLLSGHAGMPMLWWFEWIDQTDGYAPFGALRRFIAGEDLRGRNAGPAAATAQAPGAELWCRMWRRPGRVLGYLLDAQWGQVGGPGERHAAASIDLGGVRAGAMRLQWWDADLGTVVAEQAIDHPGGALVLQAPPFQRHLAFKLWR